MNHSVYLQIATLFIKADLRREERQWKRKIRRSAYDLPWENPHLLKDIGLEPDGRSVSHSEPDNVKVARRMRHLRRVLTSRIVT